MTAPVMPKAEVLGEGLTREKWLELRGYGGSYIATILGLSKYETPISLFLQLTGQVVKEVDSEPARWGQRLEQPIREGFSEDTGIVTFQPPPITLYRSLELPIATCSPDGFVGEPDAVEGLYEGKMASERFVGEWVEDGAVRPPIGYEAQVVWNLGVLGLPFGELVGLIGGNRLVHARIEADSLAFADMLEAVEEFDRKVEHRIMPDADESPISHRALTRIRSEVVDEIELPEEFLSLRRRRNRLAATKKRINDQLVAIDNRFLVAMGDHRTAVVGEEKVASLALVPGGHREFDAEPYRRLTLTKEK